MSAARLARLSRNRQIDVFSRVEKLWADDAKALEILSGLFAAGPNRPNDAARALDIIAALRADDTERAGDLMFIAVNDAHTAIAIEEIEDEVLEELRTGPDYDPPAALVGQPLHPPVDVRASAASSPFPAGTGKTDAGHAAGGAFPFGAAA